MCRGRAALPSPSRSGVAAVIKRLPFVAFVGGCAFFGGAVAGLVSPRLESPASAQRFGSGLPDPTSDVMKLGDRFEVVDKQPFDGPLFARFGADGVHVLGGALARAMRVEVTS